MTIFEIEFLLWYAARGNDHPALQEAAPAAFEVRNRFLADDLLELDHVTANRTYRITEKGMCLVDAMKNLPMPELVTVRQWRMPPGEIE